MSEAAEEKDSAAEGAAAGAAPAAGGSKLVMIVSLVNLVATLGIVGILFMSFQKESAKTSVEDIVAGQVKEGAHGGGQAGGHGGAKAAGGHGDAKAEGGHGGGEKGKAQVEVDAGKIIALEPFTVNLASGAGAVPRYVRMNVSVELEKDATDDEFKIKTPRVRDTIISLLNSRKATDISTPEGRELLKEDIKRAINGYMQTSKVKGVYFTNFAISN